MIIRVVDHYWDQQDKLSDRLKVPVTFDSLNGIRKWVEEQSSGFLMGICHVANLVHVQFMVRDSHSHKGLCLMKIKREEDDTLLVMDGSYRYKKRPNKTKGQQQKGTQTVESHTPEAKLTENGETNG